MPAKYRVAIIGHTGRGNYGHGIDTVWTRFADRCQIVGVADADEQGRAAAARRLQAPQAFADYRKMLDQTNPQIVAIWASSSSFNPLRKVDFLSNSVDICTAMSTPPQFNQPIHRTVCPSLGSNIMPGDFPLYNN